MVFGMKDVMKFSIIGCGRVGTTFGYLLKEAGHRIVYISTRTQKSLGKASKLLRPEERGLSNSPALKGEVIFITVPDEEIETVVDELKEQDLKGKYFYHTSGSKSSSVLEPLKKSNTFTGSIHPLKAFAIPKSAAETIENTYFCVEGDDKALEKAKTIIDLFGGNILRIKTEDKALYHACAAIASNLFIALEDSAFRIMEDTGLNREEVRKAFMPLIEGTLENLKKHGTEKGLTGPLLRGDIETVKKHLKALREYPEVENIYRNLSRQALKIALKTESLSPEEAQEIKDLLG